MFLLMTGYLKQREKNMSNVLIVGGTRFLGLAIAEAFLRKGGYRVCEMNRRDASGNGRSGEIFSLRKEQPQRSICASPEGSPFRT